MNITKTRLQAPSFHTRPTAPEQPQKEASFSSSDSYTPGIVAGLSVASAAAGVGMIAMGGMQMAPFGILAIGAGITGGIAALGMMDLNVGGGGGGYPSSSHSSGPSVGVKTGGTTFYSNGTVGFDMGNGMSINSDGSVGFSMGSGMTINSNGSVGFSFG